MSYDDDARYFYFKVDKVMSLTKDPMLYEHDNINTHFLSNGFIILLQNYSFSLWFQRVTEEAKGAETAAWLIHFLINMLTALKGSQFYSYSVG